MEVQVLLSCMYKDAGIIADSGLSEISTLVINQCDVSSTEMVEIDAKHNIINTPERGLSRSRNMAIQNADGDICVLSDDDEYFEPELSELVSRAYSELYDADLIIFVVKNVKNRLGSKIRRLRLLDLLKVSSVQISFKLNSVRNRIFFDTALGSGSGNGSNEETKFVWDAYHAGLNIYYYPLQIATLKQQESQWFNGHDKKFFYQRGATSRYIYGLSFAVIYGFYYAFAKHKEYKNEIGIGDALCSTYKGIIDNPIQKSNT